MLPKVSIRLQTSCPVSPFSTSNHSRGCKLQQVLSEVMNATYSNRPGSRKNRTNRTHMMSLECYENDEPQVVKNNEQRRSHHSMLIDNPRVFPERSMMGTSVQITLQTLMLILQYSGVCGCVCVGVFIPGYTFRYQSVHQPESHKRKVNNLSFVFFLSLPSVMLAFISLASLVRPAVSLVEFRVSSRI